MFKSMALALIVGLLAGALADAQAQMTELGFEPLYRVYTDWPGAIGHEIEAMKTFARDANIKAE